MTNKITETGAAKVKKVHTYFPPAAFLQVLSHKSKLLHPPTNIKWPIPKPHENI